MRTGSPARGATPSPQVTVTDQPQPAPSREPNQSPKRRKHKWSEPTRPTPNLTIRTCLKCSLIRITRHEIVEDGVTSWPEYFQESNPELRLTVLPECEE